MKGYNFPGWRGIDLIGVPAAFAFAPRGYYHGARPRSRLCTPCLCLSACAHVTRSLWECAIACSREVSHGRAFFFNRALHHTTALSGKAPDYSRAVSSTRQVPFLAPESTWQIFYFLLL